MSESGNEVIDVVGLLKNDEEVNNNSLLPVQSETPVNEPKKRGRRPGTKNGVSQKKTKLEANIDSSKRGRGRPRKIKQNLNDVTPITPKVAPAHSKKEKSAATADTAENSAGEEVQKASINNNESADATDDPVNAETIETQKNKE